MNRTYVGIDIGKAGAIAIMEHKDGGSEIHTVPMPMIKNEVDYVELSDMLRDIRVAYSCNVHIVFEKLGVIFGTGKSTAFSMGHQAGAIEMGCIAHTLSYTKVRAVDWQKQMLMGVDEICKPNSSKRDTKAMALVAIKRIFPNLELTFGVKAKKPHDGLVDAVLMAEYARRNNL